MDGTCETGHINSTKWHFKRKTAAYSFCWRKVNAWNCISPNLRENAKSTNLVQFLVLRFCVIVGSNRLAAKGCSFWGAFQLKSPPDQQKTIIKEEIRHIKISSMTMVGKSYYSIVTYFWCLCIFWHKLLVYNQNSNL